MTQPDPATLWHASSAPQAAFPALRGPLEADLVVIGGGFAGLSTALHAAEAGLSVILVEARRIGWGASGRNAGFVVPNFARADPDGIRARLGADQGGRLVGMAAGSADLVFGLIRRHAIACDAAQAGWIQPSHSPAALARADARVAAWAAEGRPVERLDAAQVAAATGVEGWLGGWIDHSGGTLNPLAYARGLAEAAATAGARLFEDSPATALQPQGTGWLVATPAGRVLARRVVLATNAHTGGLWPGLAQSFIPLRVFQIATDPVPPDQQARFLAAGRALSDSRRNLFTFRFDAAGRLITGGMHVIGLGADRRVPRRILARLDRALGFADGLRLSHAWSGMAAVSPDFLPRVIDLAPGVLAGFACNGRGIAMTTALGREMAAWAAGRPADQLAIPLRPLAPLPFAWAAALAPNLLLPVSMIRDRLESSPRLAP
jgi:glycine/D-amino acid oxidase-like deaminating enzyme